ncbi:MAG: hypothetical protein K8J08_07660 [Thermoanaerobaculia bacterium]|nr:hypothetical protein [Thermoanaerobaculia bacterium]
MMPPTEPDSLDGSSSLERSRSLRAVLLILFAALTLTGCVVALNPYYRDADLLRDPALEGRWIDEDGSEWHFTAGEGLTYQLRYTSGKGERAQGPRTVEARLLQLGDDRFLDLTVDPKADEDSLFDLHLIPVHSAWHLTIEGDTMTLASLDPNWVEAETEAGRSRASYVEVHGWRVLTGSTADLQTVLAAALGTPGGLQQPGVLHRVDADQASLSGEH